LSVAYQGYENIIALFGFASHHATQFAKDKSKQLICVTTALSFHKMQEFKRGGHQSRVCVFLLKIWFLYSALNNRHVARFQGLGGKYIFKGEDFCFYYMFKANFSEYNKIWWGEKVRGALPPNGPRDNGPHAYSMTVI